MIPMPKQGQIAGLTSAQPAARIRRETQSVAARRRVSHSAQEETFVWSLPLNTRCSLWGRQASTRGSVAAAGRIPALQFEEA
jgi:hypothetical protein